MHKSEIAFLVSYATVALVTEVLLATCVGVIGQGRVFIPLSFLRRFYSPNFFGLLMIVCFPFV